MHALRPAPRASAPAFTPSCRPPPPHSGHSGRRRCSTTQPPHAASSSPSPAPASPSCTIEVLDPSASPLCTLTPESGEILRRTLLDAKVELYQGLWAKTMNCGGAGNCGTCVVEILNGDGGILSSRTANEERKLKGKPATWRLSCQTIVGDGDNSGACEVKIGPK